MFELVVFVHVTEIKHDKAFHRIYSTELLRWSTDLDSINKGHLLHYQTRGHIHVRSVQTKLNKERARTGITIIF